MITFPIVISPSRPSETRSPLESIVVSYVLITPAKNEESNIRRTIESILSQTIRPSKWIIIDDSSTDRTAAIVKEYLATYEFIKLIESRLPPKGISPGK